MSVTAGAVARQVGISTAFKDLRGSAAAFLPQRVAVVGQGATVVSYSTDKRQLTSASEASSVYGAGSPIHLALKQLLPANGDGVGAIPVTVYPLAQGTTASAGDITPAGTQTVSADYYLTIGGVDSGVFTIAAAASVAAIVALITAAINASTDIPVVATNATTKVTLVAKWKGTSGDDIASVVVGSTTAGTTFTITQLTAGASNPTVDAALAQVGDVWESMIVNCLELTDSTALGTYSTFGEGRWGTDVHKPLVVFTGNTVTAVATAYAVADGLKTDRVNAQLVSPGSKELPFVIAARGVSRIAVLANENPAHDYATLPLTGLVPGADSGQWLLPDRELAVTHGSSTSKAVNGVIELSDTLTFYHPDGEENPAYRYVRSVVMLQAILYSVDNIFNSWNGAPLVPDDQAVSNPTAKSPKMAKAAIAAMLNDLANAAIISDPDTAIKATTAVINGSNPNRLDLGIQVQLSGSANIISIDLNFGFYFG